MKYAYIQGQAGRWPVAQLCRVLEVSRSGYHAWCGRPVSARAQRDAALVPRIRAIHAASDRSYGSPRIHQELRAEGERVSPKRVARLMRTHGVQAKRRRRFRVTTQSQHAFPLAPNVVARQFAVPTLDTVWAADVTYLWTREGWLYLAVVLDLCSRRVLGWALRETLANDLTLGALTMALTHRRPRRGVVHHSDRGSQYASTAYRAQLAAHGLTASMSRAGDCWDNAMVESFFATFKTELVHDRTWSTRADARRDVVQYLEGWYNRRRRHSALEYLSPVQFEARLTSQAA